MNLRLLRRLLLLAVAGLLPLLPLPAHAASKETLVLLNWPDYMDPALLKAFEAKYSVQVREVHYETEANMDQLLSYTGGKKYDLLVASHTKVPSFIKRGWLAPVDRALVPNLKHLDTERLPHDEALTKFAVPHLWGTVGIAFRKDLVKGKIAGWKQLFQPGEGQRGRIMMIGDVRDVVGAALKSLGYSLNSHNPGELAAAEKLLLAQRPFVKKYGYMQINKKSDLIKGTYTLAMAYSGDALTLADLSPNIGYVTPEEGTALWLDSIMVLKDSKQQKLAFQFINFLHEPENAARLAAFVSMATPNASARKLLPKDHLDNPDIYPPKAVLDKCEFYAPLPPRVLKRYNE
ncbi:MAG TPA: spermidine/putrescine ABC transporter substrate-binding protein, partial [Desulfurivibrionaceae bacterium]|nr:spermidine/putrescine ABC transporter substrate-binding protein [Desulfurivibrionaceae bacterium]